MAETSSTSPPTPTDTSLTQHSRANNDDDDNNNKNNGNENSSNNDDDNENNENKNVITSLKFKSKKRPRKKRVRKNGLDDNNDNDVDKQIPIVPVSSSSRDDEGPSAADLLLLKEAQALRQRIRGGGLDASLIISQPTSTTKTTTKATSTKKQVTDMGKIKDDGSLLQSHFSTERAGNVMEERMAKFIEDGMREKFGDDDDGHNNNEKKNNNNNDNSNDDIYEIPDRLKVKEQPMYDPSNGMPSAGLEETDIPEEEEEKRRNIKGKEDIEKSIGPRNRKRKLNVTTKNIEPTIMKSDTVRVPGNYSSNFTHHRHEWLQNHFGQRAQQQQQTSENTERQSGSSSLQHQQKWKKDNDGLDKDRKHPQNQSGGGRHKRFVHPVDANFAERFRKKWKQ